SAATGYGQRRVITARIRSWPEFVVAVTSRSRSFGMPASACSVIITLLIECVVRGDEQVAFRRHRHPAAFPKITCCPGQCNELMIPLCARPRGCRDVVPQADDPKRRDSTGQRSPPAARRVQSWPLRAVDCDSDRSPDGGRADRAELSRALSQALRALPRTR